MLLEEREGELASARSQLQAAAMLASVRAQITRRESAGEIRSLDGRVGDAPAEEGGATQAFARAEARLPPPPARRRMTHGTRRAAAHREQGYALCIWGAGEGSRSATLLLSRSLRPRSAAGQALEGARGRGEHPGLAATLPTPQRRPSWMRRSFHSHHHPGLEGSVLLVCLEPRPITVRPALCVAPPARAPTARPPKRDPSFSRGCMLSPRTTHQSALPTVDTYVECRKHAFGRLPVAACQGPATPGRLHHSVLCQAGALSSSSRGAESVGAVHPDRPPPMVTQVY